jgi:hypothetical protein
VHTHRVSLIAALGALTLALFVSAARPASADVGVTINGDAVNIAPAPIIDAGRVFVPLRGIFERLGASVVYANGTINATGNGRNIALQIGSTHATVNGDPQTIDVAPYIIGASTYVPLRFVSEALGASVNWDDANSIVAISLADAANDNAAPSDDGEVDLAPPPIPDYDQPPVPDPNEIWQPGYWAWGQAGYYWVPGTWVDAPQPGYLWTPGYWEANDRGFSFHLGYWATAVGFYGGINYGAGYTGNGYHGGRWSHNTFEYNTYVTNVNRTVIHNVYVDRTVVIERPTTRVGYNGRGGVEARPTAQQAAVATSHHIAMTPIQQRHVQAAAGDRRFLSSVNGNHPPVTAVARPLAPGKPITAAPRVEHVAPPVDRPAAPVEHAGPRPMEHAVPPVERAAPPVEHVAPPVEHVAPPVETAAPRPVEHVAPPVQHERAVPAAPAAPRPVYHAPPVQRPTQVIQRPAPPVPHVAPPVQRAAPPREAPPKAEERKDDAPHHDDPKPPGG